LTDAELRAALREHAYLEGDFLLRSGKRSRYYLDKYRFETRPEILGPLGDRIAAAVAEAAPDAVRLAAPELGAVALAGFRPALPDRPQSGEGLRHVESRRRRLRAG
jgi:orotate phosphoribosyltransferase